MNNLKLTTEIFKKLKESYTTRENDQTTGFIFEAFPTTPHKCHIVCYTTFDDADGRNGMTVIEDFDNDDFDNDFRVIHMDFSGRIPTSELQEFGSTSNDQDALELVEKVNENNDLLKQNTTDTLRSNSSIEVNLAEELSKIISPDENCLAYKFDLKPQVSDGKPSLIFKTLSETKDPAVNVVFQLVVDYDKETKTLETEQISFTTRGESFDNDVDADQIIQPSVIDNTSNIVNDDFSEETILELNKIATQALENKIKNEKSLTENEPQFKPHIKKARGIN